MPPIFQEKEQVMPAPFRPVKLTGTELVRELQRISLTVFIDSNLFSFSTERVSERGWGRGNGRPYATFTGSFVNR